MKEKSIGYIWRGIGLILVSIMYGGVGNGSSQVKDKFVCKQKILWKMRMCPNGKLVCSKNKEYVDKAERYIREMGTANFTKR